MASNDLLAVILVTDPSELNAARARVLASKGKGDITVVADVEKEVKRAPQSAISFDWTDLATVVAGDRRYCGGRFATWSIGELATSVIKRAAKGTLPHFLGNRGPGSGHRHQGPAGNGSRLHALLGRLAVQLFRSPRPALG